MPNELSKAQIEKAIEKLQRREEHLTKAIETLPDDADASDAAWFSDELKATQVQKSAFEKRLADLTAKDEREKLATGAEETRGLVDVYREAERNNTVGRMPDALRKRCLQAIRAEGEARLYGNR